MGLPEGALVQIEGTLEQRFGLRGPRLNGVEAREVEQTRGEIGVRLFRQWLQNFDAAKVGGLRLVVASLSEVQRAEGVQA